MALPTEESNMKKVYPDMRDVFFGELYKIAMNDHDVVLLMADQGAKTFEAFRRDIPDQIINVGIAEQNMVSVAAGLALAGKKVFAHAIINFFILRAYEQIKVDLSIMNLPVTLVGIGGGYAYESDGPTHHANQDYAIMRVIPGLTMYNASDTVSLTAFAHHAYRQPRLTYIRFDKASHPPLYQPDMATFTEGSARLREGSDIALVSTGVALPWVMEIAESLKEKGISASVIDIYRLKPFNEKHFLSLISGTARIAVIEEHLAYGGLASCVSDALCDYGVSLPFRRFGINDAHCLHYGNREYLRRQMGLDKETIINNLGAWVA